MQKLKEMRIRKYGTIEPISPDILNEPAKVDKDKKKNVAKFKREVESDLLFY